LTIDTGLTQGAAPIVEPSLFSGRSTVRTRDRQVAIEARALCRRYGEVTALDDLDVELRHGEVTSILGPNGAGKTTFVDLVLGRGRPDGGHIRVLGRRPGEMAVRRQSGAMLQSAALAGELTVAEHVTLHAGYFPDPMPVDDVLERTGLAAMAHRRYGKLSGGQQRRVQFAVAIAGRPRLLVLDEPTVALDPESRHAFWAIIRELAATGAAVVLTTHQLEEAEALSERVVLLAAGRLIADGSPREISSRVAARYIRCSCSLSPSALRALPEVAAVDCSQSRAVLRSHAPEKTLRALLAADDTVTDLEVGGASLEEAVLDLIRSEAA
jgi:ABC-2 type transport system ATP-binding protein